MNKILRLSSILTVAVLVSPSMAWARSDELKAPIDTNSCRLANAYMLKGVEYSGSAGTTSGGKYPAAKDQAECLKKCKTEEMSRVVEKPSTYGLKVACYFGTMKLYEILHP